jgi:hypothetical protein
MLVLRCNWRSSADGFCPVLGVVIATTTVFRSTFRCNVFEFVLLSLYLFYDINIMHKGVPVDIRFVVVSSDLNDNLNAIETFWFRVSK